MLGTSSRHSTWVLCVGSAGTCALPVPLALRAGTWVRTSLWRVREVLRAGDTEGHRAAQQKVAVSSIQKKKKVPFITPSAQTTSTNHMPPLAASWAQTTQAQRGGAAGARRGRGPARAWPTAGRRGEVTGVGCVQRRSEEALSGRGLLERALVTWGRRRCSCSSLARPSGRRRRRRRAMRSAAAAAAAARACSGWRAALC